MNKILTTTFLVATLTLAGCGEKEATLESIAVKDPKTQYVIGDNFVIPSVIATYSDKSTKDVKSECEFTGYNMNQLGEQSVVVTYKDKYTRYTINVKDKTVDPTLESISVSNPNINYTVGDEFIKPTVIASYSDGTTRDVKDEANFSGYNMAVAGEYTVKVTYKNKTTEYTITVSKPIASLVSIEVKDPIIDYVVGDDFIKPSVIATYSDETTEDVKNECVFSGFDMSKAGDYKVNVSFGGKTTSYDISVKEEQTGTDISLNDFNTKYKNAILNNHNYEATVSATFDEDSYVIASYKLYNLNDTALYSDESGTEIYAGYVKQKDQGYVNFSVAQSGGGLLLGEFLSTNYSVGISELDPFCLESVLNASFIKVADKKQDFSCTDFTSIAAIANLAFGEYVTSARAPESYVITVDDTNSKLIIKASFSYPTQVGKLSPATVSIIVSNIGAVNNVDIENHVANPSYNYKAPTKWSEDDLALFDQYFGDYVPPFVTGASYAFDINDVTDTGFKVVLAEDYASGNLSSSYATALEGKGFSKVDDKYVLEVEDEAKQLKKTYTVTLNYVSPESDADIKLYYPKGIFSVKYKYKEETTATVDTVAKLNEFLSKTAAKDILPAFPLDGSIKVTKFADGTDSANKQTITGDSYVFVSPSLGDYFRVYIPTYNEAVNFINSYGALLSVKGFVASGSLGTFAFGSYTDDYSSGFIFGDPVFAKESNYPGYLEIQLRVTKDTVNNYVDPTEKDEHTIAVANFKGGYVTVTSPTTKVAKAGELVSFTVTVNSGYSFDSVVVTCGTNNVDILGSFPNFTFTMPDGDVIVGAVVTEDEKEPTLESLSVVSPKVDYEVGDTFVKPTVKANYSDGNSIEVSTAVFSGYDMNTAGTYTVTVSYGGIEATYKITVSDKGSVDPTEFGGEYKMVIYNDAHTVSNTYILKFNDDGTGSYRRIWENISTGTINGDYEMYFLYERVGDSIHITYSSFKDGTSWTSFTTGYRLLADSSQTINNTGVVNEDGSITISLVYANGDISGNYTFTK